MLTALLDDDETQAVWLCLLDCSLQDNLWSDGTELDMTSRLGH